MTLYVTDYIRDEPIVTPITMRQDIPISFTVQHVYPELSEILAIPGFTFAANHRQPSDGSALAFVSLTELVDDT